MNAISIVRNVIICMSNDCINHSKIFNKKRENNELTILFTKSQSNISNFSENVHLL